MKKTIQVFILLINKQHHVETHGNWYSLRTGWHQRRLDQSDIQHISYVFSPFLFPVWVMHKFRSLPQIEHLLYGRTLLGFKGAQIPICAFWPWGAHNPVGFLNLYENLLWAQHCKVAAIIVLNLEESVHPGMKGRSSISTQCHQNLEVLWTNS